MKRHRILLFSVMILGIAIVSAYVCSTNVAQAQVENALENEPVDLGTAAEATDSTINGLLSAVLEVTSRTTNENIDANSLAISMLVPDTHRNIRLIDGTGTPLDSWNTPRGRFERNAVERALLGEATQVERGNRLITVVPLPFVDENCALCHGNYVDFELGEIVGAVKVVAPLN